MDAAAVIGIAAWLGIGLAVEGWLAVRQWQHMAQLRPVGDGVGNARLARYGQGRVVLRWLDAVLRVLRVVLWLGLGAIAALHGIFAALGGFGAVVLFAVFAGLDGLLHQALTGLRWWAVEKRFGMSRQGPGDLVGDALRTIGFNMFIAALAAPWLLWPFALVDAGRAAWPISAGMAVAGAGLLVWARPQLIAPMFNRFTPLAAGELRSRLDAMMKRCGTRLDDVLVMDSSRRSNLANAYFTGVGRSKRVVLFDTLIERLEPAELEAVMAHELGHYRCGHLRRYYGLVGALMFAAYAALGIAVQEVGMVATVAVPAVHVLLPALAWPIQPWLARMRRRYEYEADAYAAAHSETQALVSALRKLLAHNLNASTMDAWYAVFYATHPPGARRLARLGVVHG